MPPRCARSDRVAGAVVGGRRRARADVAADPRARELAGLAGAGGARLRGRAAIDRIAPDPPPEQAETLGRLVGDETFPEVFDTLTSPDAGIAARRTAIPPSVGAARQRARS